MSNPRHRMDPKEKREQDGAGELSPVVPVAATPSYETPAPTEAPAPFNMAAPIDPPEDSSVDLSSYPPPAASSSRDSEDVLAAQPAEGAPAPAPEPYTPSMVTRAPTGDGPDQWAEAQS